MELLHCLQVGEYCLIVFIFIQYSVRKNIFCTVSSQFSICKVIALLATFGFRYVWRLLELMVPLVYRQA